MSGVVEVVGKIRGAGRRVDVSVAEDVCCSRVVVLVFDCAHGFR